MLIYRRQQRSSISRFTKIGTVNTPARSSNYAKPLLDITTYTIEVIDNEESCEMYLQEQCRWPIKFVGLDCEWASSKEEHSHPVALLQLAFTNKACALLRLYKFTSLPPNLVQLLGNRRYGHGIKILLFIRLYYSSLQNSCHPQQCDRCRLSSVCHTIHNFFKPKTLESLHLSHY